MLIFYFILIISFKKSDNLKLLVTNPGFTDQNAWENGHVPCALDQVIFPEYYGAILPLPNKMEINGLVLPRDGVLLLNQDSTIEFSSKLTKSEKCENVNNRRAIIKRPEVRKWYDPKSWYQFRQLKEYNTYYPQMLQIPCDTEQVVITSNGPFALDMEQAPYMRFGQLNLAGSLLTKEYIQYIMPTDLGQLLFQNSDAMALEIYHSGICGCHRDYVANVELVCHNVIDNCPKARCLTPILPLGSCCPICGAQLHFTLPFCNRDKVTDVQIFVKNALVREEFTQTVDFHIDIYSLNNQKILQILLVDHNEYDEESVHFLQKLNATTNWSELIGNNFNLKINHSGRPYNPNLTFFSIMLIILCLIFVFFVALVIFAHYEPHHPALQHVPIWVYQPRHWHAFLTRTQILFSRFDQQSGRLSTTSGAQDIQETVAVGADNIVMAYNAETDQMHKNSFDNPMFSAGITENKNIQESKMSNTRKEEIQELQTIVLESSSTENTDDEHETKE